MKSEIGNTIIAVVSAGGIRYSRCRYKKIPIGIAAIITNAARPLALEADQDVDADLDAEAGQHREEEGGDQVERADGEQDRHRAAHVRRRHGRAVELEVDAAGERREDNAAQLIAERVTVARIQRIYFINTLQSFFRNDTGLTRKCDVVFHNAIVITN